jgi:SAM-dependent methyltransferase
MREHPRMRLDAAAIDAIRDLYDDLQLDGRVLDLGGAGHEHFTMPPDELIVLAPGNLVVLAPGTLPEADGAIDDAVCFDCPDSPELFAEVARVLRPGGRFVASFSNRDSPDTARRVRQIRRRFEATPDFGPVESDLRTSLTGTGDQLWAVWSKTRRGVA